MCCGLLQVELLNQSSFPFKFSSRNFICNSIGMTKLFKYALIISVAFQQDFNNYKYICWSSADNVTNQKRVYQAENLTSVNFQVSSGSAVTSKLKLNALRRWDELLTSKMSEKVNACIFRVDNNQSVTCLTNNNDLSPPIETSVNIIMNCECCL